MHRTAVLELLGECGEHIDALELNGLRPWSENRQAILLGQTWSKPLISGGDRHAIEPNAVLQSQQGTDLFRVRGANSAAAGYTRSYRACPFGRTLTILMMKRVVVRGVFFVVADVFDHLGVGHQFKMQSY